LQRDGDFELPPFCAAHGFVSAIDVVIKRNEQLYGVLKIDSDEQHDCDRQGIEFPAGFANVLTEAAAGPRAWRSCKPPSRRSKFGSTIGYSARHLPGNNSGVPDGIITLNCDSEPLVLDLDTVTASIIVVAEVVTNCYDHAFATVKSG
jgi:hypothetical protein